MPIQNLQAVERFASMLRSAIENFPSTIDGVRTRLHGSSKKDHVLFFEIAAVCLDDDLLHAIAIVRAEISRKQAIEHDDAFGKAAGR